MIAAHFTNTSGHSENHECHLYRIGGVEDHIHIVTHLHPSIALADMVKTIKLAGTDFKKGMESSLTSEVGRMDMPPSHILLKRRRI